MPKYTNTDSVFGTWVYEYGGDSTKLDINDWGRLYLFSFYWAITTISTVGFGDISTYNSTEKCFAVIWMMIGVGFYSYSVGALSSIMSQGG